MTKKENFQDIISIDVVGNLTILEIAAPTIPCKFTCYVIIIAEINVSLSFSFETFEPTQVRVISIIPSQIMTSTTIYGFGTINGQTKVSIIAANLPQFLMPSQVLITSDEGQVAEILSLEHMTKCSANGMFCNMTKIVILAPFYDVSRNVTFKIAYCQSFVSTCGLFAPKMSMKDENQLYFSLSYFIPCSFASFCESFSLMADTKLIIQSPPVTKACEIRYCVDANSLPSADVLDFYPSQGPASGGTTVTMTIRNFPIVALTSVEISVGYGALLQNAEVVSYSEIPGSCLSGSISTLIFRTAVVPSYNLGILSSFTYGITSLLGPRSVDVHTTFQYTPVVQGQTTISRIYPSAVLRAVPTIVTLELQNFPKLSPVDGPLIHTTLNCVTSDVSGANISFSDYTVTIISVLVFANYSGSCSLKILLDTHRNSSAGLVSLEFVDEFLPTVLYWFPRRAETGEQISCVVAHLRPDYTFDDVNIFVNEVDKINSIQANVISFELFGPSGCQDQTCSEYSVSFVFPNISDCNHSMVLVSLFFGTYSTQFEIPFDKSYLPKIVFLSPPTISVTDSNTTDIRLYLSHSSTFCANISLCKVSFGTSAGKVLLTSFNGSLRTVLLRAPLIRNNSYISCKISDGGLDLEFCLSDDLAKLIFVAAPLEIEPIDCNCAGGSAVTITAKGWDWNLISEISDLVVTFGGAAGTDLRIIQIDSGDSTVSSVILSVLVPRFNAASNLISGCIELGGNKIMFPAFFECYETPVAILAPSTASMNGFARTGQSIIRLTLDSFLPMSSVSDLVVQFGNLVCDGLNCSVLRFKNFAGGIDVSLTVPPAPAEGMVTVTVLFVGISEVVGGDPTVTYTRSMRRASVPFLYTRPVISISSALYCAQCHPWNSSVQCLVNGLCGLQQNVPESNSLAASGNGVLTVVVENAPWIPYNETNGMIASSAAVFVTLGDMFASMLRVVYQSATQLTIEVQASGPIPVGDTTMYIIIQPDTAIPNAADVASTIRIYDDQMSLTCDTPMGCAGPIIDSQSLFITLFMQQLDDEWSSLLYVLFGNILVLPSTKNCTVSYCTFKLTPPEYFCGACKAGTVNVPLRLVYSATGSEITSTTFSFWAAPSIDSARFDATEVQIVVRFDQPTNRAGVSSHAISCSYLLVSTAELGVDPQCIWLSDSTLSIIIGSRFSIKPGSVVAIRKEAGLRSVNGVSDISSASATVQGPSKVEASAILELRGPETIDACSVLELDAFALDASSAGHITYTWRCLNDASLDALLVTANGPSLKLAAAAPEISSVGKSYEMMVLGTDSFGGTRGPAVFSVYQQGWPVPSVSFFPLASSGINFGVPVLVRGEVAFSRCPVATGSFKFAWQVLAGNASSFQQIVAESKIPQVLLSPTTYSSAFPLQFLINHLFHN